LELNERHNTCSGRIFILGTGPSLIEQLPLLAKLENEATFTCNTIFAWKELPFTPTYYGLSDVYDQKAIDNLALTIPAETEAFNVQWPGHYNNERFMYVEKAHDSHQVRKDGFAGLNDILPPLPTGRTTPLTLAQLAAWFGYREFYFLGFEQTRGYCYGPDLIASGIQKVPFPIDKNPRYRIAVQHCSWRMRQDVEAVGGKVIDCTPGGLLNRTQGAEVKHGLPPFVPPLEYMELADVLEG